MSETITADSWAIYQLTDFCPIRGKNAVKKRQIASLTKMFTLAAALRIEKRLRLNPSTMVRITDSFEIGTTSNLERGYWMTINDLYYGMMLPSGNDASLVIAQYFGYFLQVESRCEAYELRKRTRIDLTEERGHFKLFLSFFLSEMNTLAKELKLTNTSFDNPHGLDNKYNVSTAQDLAVAVDAFLKNQTFKGIVNTQGYTGKMVEFVGEEEETKVKEMNWVNTNVLLKEGYEGVKTGYTGDAGGCLVSVKEIRFKNQSNKYLIIVLASKDQASRFTDTQIIAKNHFKYLQMMSM